MEIDELKRIQKDEGICDIHMVWLGPVKFTIAHTDEERATLHPLTDCGLHQWLESCYRQPAPSGLYTAYPEEGWTLVPYPVEQHADDCEVVTSQSTSCTCGEDDRILGR